MAMNNRKLVPTQEPGVLDFAPGAAAAYSLRTLSYTYAGPVVTVRRSTDSAEADFTAAEVSDGTLAAWCGAGDGFVKQWWSQTGSNHATQSTAGYQPKLVSAGVVILEGEKPAVQFDGTDDVLDLSAGIVASLYTNVAVAAVSSVSNNPIIGTDSGQSIGLWSDSFWYENNGTGGFIRVPFTQDTEQHIYSATKSGNTADDFSLHTDGAYIGAVTGGSGFSSATWKYIGGRKLSSAAYFTGTISELLIYPTDMTALRQRIEANVNRHFGIF